ncbi:MAG TPA: flagellar hook assembly protein FlgD [Burkholderiales bacterium]|nr:flagellar hook assembly protein FlgD [Burkholderiales bacterium]
MLPALQAIGMVFSAINAATTLNKIVSGSGSDATATATNSSTKGKAMNSIQDTATATGGGAAASGASSTNEMSDRFLKLLVTQMKNQDPLNPLDNAQVTSQLAQINTVSGIEKLNSTMQNLSTSFMAGQSLQSASLIGRSVLTDSNRLAWNGATVTGAAELAQPADRMTVTIADAAGNAVRTMELGPQKAGTAQFQWDGLNDAGARVADGAYTFRIAAQRGGQPVTATPLGIGRVASVSFGNEGLRVDVDGIGAIQMFQIKRIL